MCSNYSNHTAFFLVCKKNDKGNKQCIVYAAGNCCIPFASLEFQTLEGVIRAIGLPKCDLCTYCWDGEE